MTLIDEEHTVLSNIALAISRVAETYGCNPQALLKDAGIDADSLQQPDSRISLNQHQKLWQLAIARSQRPCIGLDIGRAISPGTIHGLGLGWLVSDTLKSALERLIRFQRLVSTNADIMLHETRETYELIYQAKKITPDFQTASADALLIATTRLCRLALSEQITPQKVELPHDDTDCASAYQNFFNCSIAFGANRWALTFDKNLLERHLPDANPLLARITDESVTEYLARYELADFVTQVRVQLIENLTESKPDQVAVAKKLNVSVRQLQRELQERGFTFKGLVEEVRKDLATQYLSEKTKTIGEITYLLGYTEPANFGRSFKKWTGQTPGEFRAAR